MSHWTHQRSITMIPGSQSHGQKGMKFRLNDCSQNQFEKSFRGQCQKIHYMSSEVNIYYNKQLQWISNSSILPIYRLNKFSFPPIPLHIGLFIHDKCSWAMNFTISKIPNVFLGFGDNQLPDNIPLSISKGPFILHPVILEIWEVEFWYFLDLMLPLIWINLNTSSMIHIILPGAFIDNNSFIVL